MQINPLSVISFANIFSHSMGGLFILFWVSFAVQKLLSLIKYHLFIFIVYFYFYVYFIFITVGGGTEKISLWIMLESVWPMFSSNSFMVSSLIFRSLIHLGFIFVYGVRKCYNFILFHVAVQFSQHHLLKGRSFLHCIFWPPFS